LAEASPALAAARALHPRHAELRHSDAAGLLEPCCPHAGRRRGTL
jgi:hypothetical protein